MTRIFLRLKELLSSFLLRGRVLEWWLQRKVARLEGIYLQTLIANSQNQASPFRPLPKLSADIRNILFISDINWENRELTPELAKIAPVQVLNLRPALAGLRGRAGNPDAVCAHIRAFMGEQPSFSPDVILFYARSNLLSEEVFDLLRSRWQSPLLGLNLDDKIEFLPYRLFGDRTDNYQRWVKYFDLNLSNVRATVDWYLEAGAPAYYMAEGYHPKAPAPAPNTNYRYEISFVGGWKPERETFFRHLRGLGVPIEPLGFGWPDSESGRNPEAVYRNSQISLGIGFATPSHQLTTLKTRDFECPGSGACYLTTYNWELALHFEIGKEILCYRSLEELVEIFSYYRRRPEDCFRIAQAAYQRCLREHTWEKRFRDLFAAMGLRPVKAP